MKGGMSAEKNNLAPIGLIMWSKQHAHPYTVCNANKAEKGSIMNLEINSLTLVIKNAPPRVLLRPKQNK
jgi:hypothetical protein